MAHPSSARFARAFITGIRGSGARYLVDYLLSSHPDVEVHGLARPQGAGPTTRLPSSWSQIRVHECDLVGFRSVLAALEDSRPDVIFHLASHAKVLESFEAPTAVLANNILGTSVLLEAVRAARLDAVIQLCSTSEVYGQVDPRRVPIREDCPLQPASPYAVSKATQDLLGWTYFNAYRMPIVRTRMFTYVNPLRADLFATSFARQVARIELGLQDELVHGNLDSVRTLIDVRDAVRAYWIAAERCRPGEAYNIGGVTAMTVGEFLQRLVARSTTRISLRLDERLLRPADVTLQIPDTSKFVAETGWAPEYTFEDSLDHLLDHCRREAAGEVGRIATDRGSLQP